MATSYVAEERGTPNTGNYRVFFRNAEGHAISPFHDIPLFADEPNKIYHMVVEIPRWTNAKMEIATKEKLNPIKQDVKKGELRYVKNPFPHKGYIWNYGAIPQTWEDPQHTDESTGCKGDNDPIDVVEIGSQVYPRGSVIKVKVLGVMALIDEGETDWKLVAISTDDPLAQQMNDINDVEVLMPGLMTATHEWFKIYKMPDGKPANEFAFDGKPKGRAFAEKIIQETHKYWKELMATNGDHELERTNISVQDSSHLITPEAADAVIQETPPGDPPTPLSVEQQTAIDKWHYITLP